MNDYILRKSSGIKHIKMRFMILAVNFIIIQAVEKERKFKQNQAYPQRMQITQINEVEVKSQPNGGNRSFRPSH